MAAFGHIEGRHDPSRRHSALGYLPPVSHEERTRTEP
ncbi:MAG: hypothetical protein AVDCRST_MAG31-1164 [uncultured Sphingomonas sp.]|uniref:Uncharacterized protein n=1 Tax=uncultured Sphingomonas sp. TaxID=158754 RepID=A0A6J4T5H0_9SPHN|nr:MAG: hypothetical protein AVDCRST_MAG31-1164 [uncultured Sphingomonas sp.]